MCTMWCCQSSCVGLLDYIVRQHNSTDQPWLSCIVHHQSVFPCKSTIAHGVLSCGSQYDVMTSHDITACHDIIWDYKMDFVQNVEASPASWSTPIWNISAIRCSSDMTLYRWQNMCIKSDGPDMTLFHIWSFMCEKWWTKLDISYMKLHVWKSPWCSPIFTYEVLYVK